ncbi:universal stress protein [Sphingopyxis sp. FBM22]|nr:universal stress protein [Sphingopyxis yananensis]
MRNILIHADQTSAMTGRTETALEIGRRCGSHLHFLISSPYQHFIASDPFGGIYLAREQLAMAQMRDAELEKSLSAQLSLNEVPWDISIAEGMALSSLSQYASLSDLVIVSLGGRDQRGRAEWTLAADLTMTVPVPVLALPSESKLIDLDAPIMIAWNGSPQAAKALRSAVPLIRHSQKVVMVQIGSDDQGIAAEDALKYLSRHDIHAELRQIDASDDKAADLLTKAAQEIKPGLIVMGVFGRSMLRETLFGGVTRTLLEESPAPLLLAH